MIDLGNDQPVGGGQFRLPAPGEVVALMGSGKTLHFAGYPGSEGHNGRQLKGAVTTRYFRDGGLLGYDIDTATGNSGGPVWFEEGGDCILAGIHVIEGKAVLLDGASLEEVNAWIGGQNS